MSLKIAIVGCGKIADGHVEEIQKMPDVARVVAVCDLERLMAEQIAVRFGIPTHYDHLDELLDRERPDVVHITTPPASHLRLATQAMDAGAHVFVEKPLTLDYPSAKALVDHAVRTNKKLTIGYTYFFDPPAIAMRELLASGAVGDIVHVESVYGYNLAGPFGAAILSDPNHWVHRMPGKLVQNNLDHLLYKLTEFLEDAPGGEDPLAGLTVNAWGFVRRTKRYGDARDNAVDEVRLMMRHGATTFSGMFSSQAKPVGHLARIYGTKNTLEVDYTMRTVTCAAQSKLPSAFGRLVPAFDAGTQLLREGLRNVARFARSDFHYFSGLQTLFAKFYRSIAEGTPPPFAYSSLLRISALMDEIFRQIPQGRPDR